MPIVNILHKKRVSYKEIEHYLRSILTKELSCSESKLSEKDFSIAFIKVKGGIKADIEIRIFAQIFEERVNKIDEIPKKIKKGIAKKVRIYGYQVFLFLGEIGF